MKPKIVVLDGYTLTTAQPGQPAPAGEPSWAALEKLGDVTVFDRTAEDQIVEQAADAAIILTNKAKLSADTIAKLPSLRYIGVLATGTNVVDLEAAKARKIPVTNVPGYSSESVAQHVFALLLELTNHAAAHSTRVHEGEWSHCEDFCFTVAPLVELAGKTLGIVGLGDIGKRVAMIGHALGMNIAAAHQSSMNRVSLPGIDINWLPVDELFAQADAITLHCPLTDKTKHMVNKERLATMKPSAYIINTGRGPLIDEDALAAALKHGKLAGAGLDVLSIEPPSIKNPLLAAPRCVVTPHIAWATREARCRLMDIAAGNVLGFLERKPINVVNDVA